MENKVLNSILIVKGPSSLPSGSHEEAVERLSKKHKFVILCSFGDETYDFPDGYILPLNVRIIQYEYETLDESLDEVKECLKGFGVGLISRHKNELDRLPFFLTGSILQVPTDTELSFFSVGDPLPIDEKSRVVADNEWDL